MIFLLPLIHHTHVLFRCFFFFCIMESLNLQQNQVTVVFSLLFYTHSIHVSEFIMNMCQKAKCLKKCYSRGSWTESFKKRKSPSRALKIMNACRKGQHGGIRPRRHGRTSTFSISSQGYGWNYTSTWGTGIYARGNTAMLCTAYPLLTYLHA